MAVSVLRPWDSGRTPGIAGTGPADVTASDPVGIAPPSPTPAASLAPDEIACSPDGWHVVSLDHFGDWAVRSWVPARAVRAASPIDPGIHPVTLESPEVLAIGACSPSTQDAAGREVPGGPVLIVHAWQIDADGATPLALAVRRQEATPGVATLYHPIVASVPPYNEPTVWPSGRFVVELSRAGDEAAAQPEARTPDGTLAGWFIGLVVRGHG